MISLVVLNRKYLLKRLEAQVFLRNRAASRGSRGKSSRCSDSPRRPTQSVLSTFDIKCSRPPAELAREDFPTSDTVIDVRHTFSIASSAHFVCPVEMTDYMSLRVRSQAIDLRVRSQAIDLRVRSQAIDLRVRSLACLEALAHLLVLLSALRFQLSPTLSIHLQVCTQS